MMGRRESGKKEDRRKRTEERGLEDALTLTPFPLGHFTLRQSSSALPASGLT